nr:immunoglobulin heavy chain junction region [Mus musculus]
CTGPNYYGNSYYFAMDYW